jgi:hypothetical protein
VLRDGGNHAGARDRTPKQMQNAVLDPLWRRPGRCWLLARSEERPTFRVKQQNRPFRGAFALAPRLAPVIARRFGEQLDRWAW